MRDGLRAIKEIAVIVFFATVLLAVVIASMGYLLLTGAL